MHPARSLLYLRRSPCCDSGSFFDVSQPLYPSIPCESIVSWCVIVWASGLTNFQSLPSCPQMMRPAVVGADACDPLRGPSGLRAGSSDLPMVAWRRQLEFDAGRQAWLIGGRGTQWLAGWRGELCLCAVWLLPHPLSFPRGASAWLPRSTRLAPPESWRHRKAHRRGPWLPPVFHPHPHSLLLYTPVPAASLLSSVLLHW